MLPGLQLMMTSIASNHSVFLVCASFFPSPLFLSLSLSINIYKLLFMFPFSFYMYMSIYLVILFRP